MLAVLETFSVYLFFLLYTLFQCYSLWQSNMSKLTYKEETEDLPLWGMPQVVADNPISDVTEVKYEKSTLTDKHLAFVDDMVNSLSASKEDCSQSFDDDLITMDDWKEEPSPVEVSPRLSSTATARIVDYELGDQVWVVEVVGEEQDYLHISDGSAREWVNVEMFGRRFIKGDILSLLVERYNDRSITVKAADILQRTSNDFLIPDEQWYESEEHEAVV